MPVSTFSSMSLPGFLVVVAASLQTLGCSAHGGGSAVQAGRKMRRSAASLRNRVFDPDGDSDLSDEDRQSIRELFDKATSSKASGQTNDEICGRGDAKFAELLATHKNTGNREDWLNIKQGLEYSKIEASIQRSMRETQGEIELVTQEIQRAEVEASKLQEGGGVTSSGEISLEDLTEGINAWDEKDDAAAEGFAEKMGEILQEKRMSMSFETCLEACQTAELSANDDEEMKEYMTEEVYEPACTIAVANLKAQPEANRAMSAEELRSKKTRVDQLKEGVKKCESKLGSFKKFKAAMLSLTSKQEQAFLNERRASNTWSRTKASLETAKQNLAAQENTLGEMEEVLKQSSAMTTEWTEKLDKVKADHDILNTKFEEVGKTLDLLTTRLTRASKATAVANDFKSKLIVFITSMVGLYEQSVHNPIKKIVSRLTRQTESNLLQEGPDDQSFDKLFELKEFCAKDTTRKAFADVDFLKLCNHTPGFICDNEVIQDPDGNAQLLKKIVSDKQEKANAIIARLKEYLLPEYDQSQHEQDDSLGFASFVMMFARTTFATAYVQLWLEPQGDEDCGEASAGEAVGPNTRGALLKVWRKMQETEKLLATQKDHMNTHFLTLQDQLKKIAQEHSEISQNFKDAVEKQDQNDKLRTEANTLLVKMEDEKQRLEEEDVKMQSDWEELKRQLEAANARIVDAHRDVVKGKEAAAAALLERGIIKERNNRARPRPIF